MSAHSERYPRRVPVLTVCRAALQCGPLINQGMAWRYGRRMFNQATVARLIELGEAVRDGDMVRAV